MWISARRVVHPRLELAPRLLERHRVRAGRALFELRERAEEARRDADVRHLDAHVAVEVRAVAVQPLAHLVGELADGDDVGVPEERDAVVEREPLAGRAPSLQSRRASHRLLQGFGRFDRASRRRRRSTVSTAPSARTKTATRPPRSTHAASSLRFTTCASSRLLFLPTPEQLAVGDGQSALGRDESRELVGAEAERDLRELEPAAVPVDADVRRRAAP